MKRHTGKPGTEISGEVLMNLIKRYPEIVSEIGVLLRTYTDQETECNEKIYGTTAERVACACEDIVHKHRSSWEDYSVPDRKVAAREILSAQRLFLKVVPDGYISGYTGKVITEIPF